jgi:hypothetical protein
MSTPEPDTLRLEARDYRPAEQKARVTDVKRARIAIDIRIDHDALVSSPMVLTGATAAAYRQVGTRPPTPLPGTPSPIED